MTKSYTKKIKILRIIARLNVGGPAIHTILLSEKINNDKYSTKLVAGPVPSNEGDMSYLADEKDVTVSYLNNLQRELSPKDDLKALSELLSIIKKFQPDIIHTHTAKAGFIGRGAAILYNSFRKNKIKTIHTFHGHVFHGYFSPLKTKLFLNIERTLAKYTDTIITITDRQQEEILKLGIGQKKQHRMIPLGLDLERFYINNNTSFLHTQYSIPPEKKLIGIVARFTQIKNLKMFIRVANIMYQKDQNLHFFMIGDGEDREMLEAYTNETKASLYITFTGFLKNLPDIYSSLDLVLLTSNNEGSPVSIIEAMTSGTSVVSTSVGGVPDLFTNYGKNYLVNPNDDVAMANAASQILLPHNNQLFIEEHQSATYSKYNFNRLVDDLMNTYNELTHESIYITA
ncbi:glycosyltransferase [Flammeovirga kamogawensis]|uniref:Glycosyltransferase n=1 Tax=Flammeovirga kamogawensis TaxID=373891 RepID=A0ABX8GU14_9BACT|nr:glycosyltransferase [Flammeovirga kamogawensis]MBB6459851.1 glycosyltransferase involved in cell wall biosynthesis [Flammeovirga kamogawensis]QWG07095.1 glycosyltransferase [Flammeovirga kamogawensis]TRX68916.1 glycosyltransferase family 4 protein [Flammeovirga kamogawensis]